ncbi:MAG: hypothetical protein ACPG45_10045 [Flavobacteriaceae bacterium]
MKTSYIFIIACFIVLTVRSQEQDSIPVTSVVKVALTEKIALDERVSIELVEVLSDSRCPKNVQCIWAGEAQILVNIYKKGQKMRQEILTLHPAAIQENVFQLLSSKLTKVTAVHLRPYPNGIDKVALGDYSLELTVLH